MVVCFRFQFLEICGSVEVLRVRVEVEHRNF